MDQVIVERSADAVPSAAAANRMDVRVDGMTCAACVRRVERAMSAVPGVEQVAVNLATERAPIAAGAGFRAAALADALVAAGCPAVEDTLDLAVAGMTCASCAGRVERALLGLPGVIAAEVNLATERARVRVLAEAADTGELAAAVRRAGYDAKPVEAAGDEEQRSRAARERVAWRDGVFAALALASLVQIVFGARFYRGAWKTLLAGTGNMDTLVALGTSAAFGLSLWELAAGQGGHLCFEASAAVIALVAELGSLGSDRDGGDGVNDALQGRRFHRVDGVSVRLDQSGAGARYHPGRADGLAVHRGGVRGRPDHDRAAGAAATRRAAPEADRGSARPGRARGVAGRMEGHAAMDMSLSGGSVLSRALSSRGFTAISHFYVMDWASVWSDIVLGLLISGALAAWAPHGFWTALFLSNDPVWSKIVGPLIGPIVAVLSFVCSIGNVPLAAVLWNGGISFGGVVAFLLADLIVLPILDIYRKYYGMRMAALLLGLFYVAMAAAGYIVELLFGAVGLVPSQRGAQVLEASVRWNYTTVLNILFLALSAILVWRFLRTGGPKMLRMMSAKQATGQRTPMQDTRIIIDHEDRVLLTAPRSGTLSTDRAPTVKTEGE